MKHSKFDFLVSNSLLSPTETDVQSVISTLAMLTLSVHSDP